MSEKKEYWQELFGDDSSTDLADELGFESLPDSPNAGNEGETFPIDDSFFAPEGSYGSPETLQGDDTNVIPPQVKDLSAYTNGNEDYVFDPDAFADADNVESEPEEDEEEEAYWTEEDYPDEDYEEDEEEDKEDDEDAYVEQRAIQITRKKRTGLLGGFMYAAFILGAGVILASVGWMWADDVLGLTKDDSILTEITIPENFTIEEVAEELYAQGVINFRWLFNMFAEMYDAYERIQPGVYQVALVDYRAIINSLNQRSGERIEVSVLIPEGRTMREVFEILQENGVATVEGLEYAAENGTFEFRFLEDVPLNAMNRLEGYLFPDTYTFFMHQNPEQVIRSMLRNFHNRMVEHEIYYLIEESPFSLHEIVNIASMIEKEIANRDEGPLISSVIHNRLNIDMLLQIDATIQYILGEERREILLQSDLEIESPYNTYLHLGLPYGPIANPGVASILAALHPADTNFLFYALHQDGHHEFFPNFDQHRNFTNSPNFAHYGRF